jgi:hypothetical protein
MGREEKGREGKGRKEGKEGRRKEMTWPPNKIPGSATDSQSQPQCQYI